MNRSPAVIIGILILALARPVRGDILSLINQGMTDEALDSISALSSTFSQSGNILFYKGLLEPNADSSAALLQSALQNKVDSQFAEVIAVRLAFYYLSTGDYNKAGQNAERYRSLRKDGDDMAAMDRIAVLTLEQGGDPVSGLQTVEQTLKDNPQGETAQWSLVDKARLIGEGSNAGSLTKMLKRMSQDRSAPGASIALELLVKSALANKQFGEAVQAFGVLKEQFPHAVGLAALADQMTEIPDDEVKDVQAEKVTGTYYAVKVGVFSDKSNADKQVDRCRQPGQPFSVDSKEIGGKTYFIVYIGRYRSFAEADAVKAKLEDQFSESYQVMAR